MELADFSTIIRSHRKACGLSQSELAVLANVSRSAVYDIEKGKASIQLDTLLAILQPLNICLKMESPYMPYLEQDKSC